MDLLAVSKGIFPLDLGTACLLAATTGILSHVLYFIRGYRVPQSLSITTYHFAAGAVLYLWSIFRSGPLRGSLKASTIGASYLTALFASIVVYRLWFHPLRRFPGPLGAKVTKLYSVWVAREGKLHLEWTSWAGKYGDVVRVGPNELALFSVDAVGEVHGPHSKCGKAGTHYSQFHHKGEHHIDSMQDREVHRWRRQPWEKAMTSKALERYEGAARDVTRQWIDKVAAFDGRPVDTTLFSTLIPFENIGKIGYSRDFGLLRAGRESRAIHLIGATFAAQARLGFLSWPIPIMSGLGLSGEAAAFEQVCVDLVDDRAKMEDDQTDDCADIMSYLLADYRAAQPKTIRNANVLYAESQIIMIGGTETIAVLLSFAFYYLARDAALQEKLREEVASAFGASDSVPDGFADSDLRRLPLLDAVVTEVLRIQNPTATTGARLTPPEGIVVDGTFVPGGTEVFVPIYALQRSEKYFKRPDEFIPERWTTQPDLVIDRRAWFPFLIGAYNCVGRRVGMMVSRLVLASTVYNYRFRFAPGEDGVDVVEKTVNHLVLKPGPLRCVFERRDRDA